MWSLRPEALIAFTLLSAACDARTIAAVGGPGGVYRADGECALQESSRDCPIGTAADPTLRPQLGFESAGDTGFSVGSTATVSNLRVTCKRSFCGTGSLAFHAVYRWTQATANDKERLGSITYKFDAPVDLLGRTIGFHVYTEGRLVPINAQVGVIYKGFWHWVAWSPLDTRQERWHSIAGVVSPENPLTKIEAGATSVPVTGFNIDVYLSVPPANGGPSAWTGEVYIDDVGWR
jgi:hypothetical protein